jgi:hypothetical protein
VGFVVVSEWVCLRCEWIGGGDGTVCPRCGVPLYRRAPAERRVRPSPRSGPATPSEVATATGASAHRGGHPPRSSSVKPHAHAESDPPTTPIGGTGGRWIAAIALAGLVATAGIGDWLVRRNTPDTAALSGASEGRQVAAATDVTSVDDLLAKGESSVGHDTLRSSAEYIAEAAAICDATSTRFRVATEGLSSTDDREAWYAAAVRYSEKALAKLRALPLPKRQGQRARFGEFHSVLRRQVEALRRVAAATAGNTSRAEGLQVQLLDLIHTADRREPLLESCPVRLGG